MSLPPVTLLLPAKSRTGSFVPRAEPEMHFETTHPQSQTAECYDARSVANAAASVRDKLPMSDDDCPLIGVILGSGLGLAADRMLAAGGKGLATLTIIRDYTLRLIIK